MGKVLYEWQKECLERWFANHGRGMVQAVTGSGKTLLALEAIRRLDQTLSQSLHVKIVVPTGALMRQWKDSLNEFFMDSANLPDFQNSQKSGSSKNLGMEIGLRGNGYQNPPDCKYMIYVVNSARYELARQILLELRQGEAVLLIADECHHYASRENRLIFEFLPYIEPYESRFFSLGLSATLPSGQAQKDLAAALGRKIYTYKMNQAADLHTVCPYDIYHISLSFQEDEREAYEDLTDKMARLYGGLLKKYPYLRDKSQRERYELLRSLANDKDRGTAKAASLYMALSYRRKGLVHLASDRYACSLDLVERLGDNEKIMIFGERIKQAEHLYSLLQKSYPGKVGRYHSQMGAQANRNTLHRFRDGSIRILIACKAMDEGVDVPDASVGIILSGSSAQRQRIQRLGRIIRKKEGKGKASLYYLHIEETSEDICYLPDTGENQIFELQYDSQRHEFYNQPYDQASEKMLDKLLKKSIDENKIAEVVRCLRLGIVRSDWTLDKNEITDKIKNTRILRDKNYWICMKKLAEEKTQKQRS